MSGKWKNRYLYNRKSGKDPEAINKTEKLMATTKRTPYVGAIVILHLAEGDQIQNNYSREMPAVICRCFGGSDTPPHLVNLKGLPDGPGSIWRTSIPHQEGVEGAVIAQGASWRYPEEPLKRGEAPMAASE